MTAAPRLGVVLVGAGHLGHYHLQKILASPQARLLAVVDPDPHKLARARGTVVEAATADGAIAVQYCHALGEVALGSAADAVAAIVAAPTPLHVPLTLACFARGWHALVEKPLAATSAACTTLVAAAQRCGLLLQVGHTERFNPAVRAVLPMMADARYVVCERLGPFSGRSVDTDVVLDLMVHDLDLVAAALGTDVVEVQSVGIPVLTHEIDMASARLRFASGAVAQLSAGRVSLQPSRNVRFFTADCYVSVDCMRHEVKSVRRGPPRAPNPWPTVRGEVWPLPAQDHDALGAQDEAYFAAVRTGTAATVAGEAGLWAVRMAERVKAAFQPWPGPMTGAGPPRGRGGATKMDPAGGPQAAQPSTLLGSPPL